MQSAGTSEDLPHESSSHGVPAEWEPGMVILGLYEVTDFLGQGGMGKVYRVHHRRWDIDLAVKSPKPRLLSKPREVENFERECETWVNLGLHPHIVTCYYVRRLGGIPRIFAEYVNGGSLRDWIKSRRLYQGDQRRALARIASVGIQIAWGLHYAHVHDLTHRDVKPGNVLMTEDGTAKVTDFGLARARQLAAQSEAGAANTRSRRSAGGMTPAYSSPEQARRQTVTHATDIWSWAISVVEMLYGKVRWDQGIEVPALLETLIARSKERADIATLPDPFADLLRHCLRERPEDRPASMLDVATALTGVYEEIAGAAYPHEAPREMGRQADNLNNRAVSLLDLGKQDDAERLWQEAIEVTPHHAEATYNLSLVHWRDGRATDEAVLHALQEVRLLHPDAPLPSYLIAQIHLERDDCLQAVDALEAGQGDVSQGQSVVSDLESARKRMPESGRFLGALQGHADAVKAVAFGPDSRSLVSGSEDNTIRVWDASTGSFVRSFDGHLGSVEAVTVSADAQHLLSASRDRTLRLWDFATGACIRVMEGHEDVVRSAAFTGDARYALSGGHDRTIRLWDMRTGACVAVLSGHSDWVTGVAITKDGRVAASVGADKVLIVWDVVGREAILRVRAHAAPLTCVGISPEGDFVITGGLDGLIKLWKVAEKRCTEVFEGHTDAVESVALSSTGAHLVSCGRDKTVRLWEKDKHRCLRTFTGHEDHVTCVAFSPDGRTIASGGRDKTVRIWGTGAGNAPLSAPLVLCRAMRTETAVSTQRTFQRRLKRADDALASGDAVRAAAHVRHARTTPGYARNAQALARWRRLYLLLPRANLLAGWEGATLKGHEGPVKAVALSRDGNMAVSGGADYSLRLWRLAEARCVRVFDKLTAPPNSVCLSRTGLVVAGCADNSLVFWDPRSGTYRPFEARAGSVEQVCLSEDGRFALSGGWDIKVWDVETGRCIRSIEGAAADAVSVAIGPLGTMAVTGTTEGRVSVWDLLAGTHERSMKGHTGAVRALAVSSDGMRALSGCATIWARPCRLMLWDLSTGELLGTLEGHANNVTSVALSIDGRHAVSSGKDGAVKLWHLDSGECIREFRGHKGGVEDAALSPDARHIVSAGEDGTLRVWVLDWDLGEEAATDWDDRALPLAEIFLAQHTPYAGSISAKEALSIRDVTKAMTRSGRPSWSEEDFDRFMFVLGCAGLGWLRREGVAAMLFRLSQRRRLFGLLPMRPLTFPQKT